MRSKLCAADLGQVDNDSREVQPRRFTYLLVKYGCENFFEKIKNISKTY